MSELSNNPLVELAPVRQRLALAEPCCLALVEATAAAGLPDGFGDEMGARLRRALRPYDELLVVGDGRFALVLPTLAGAEALRRRMSDVLRTVGQPPGAGPGGGVMVALGGSVRQPQDSLDGFIGRVVGAVDRARADGGRAPVIV